ncbi:MAG: arginine repressor [Lachnospiraceae bacterium]|nr:arginine repressor [Lachnospiraceae bacterium]
MRYEAILKLIREQDIGTQKDLAEALRKIGFDVTQATVSRDIRELKLMKAVQGEGNFVYRSEPKEAEDQRVSAAFYTLFATSVVSVAQVLNQVVIKTLTGMANAVCAGFDSLPWEGVLGTIAGDDTILVITESEQSAKKLADMLRGFQKS